VALDAVDHRLVAILSADVVGYSRLMARDEAATVRTLNAYREQMAVLIRHYHGRVVGSPGDNLLAELPSALDAVRCAVEAQRVLSARNADQPPDRKMEFRIGIHLGDVMIEGDQIYGDGVNIAARLEGLAEAGGICLSGAVYEQVRNKLSIRFEDVGDQSVKNIPHPVRVYRVRWEPEGAANEAMPREAVLTSAGFSARPDIAVLVVPAAWVLYVAIVFEILFMISPFALYYYSAYGPSLNLFHRSPWTAWLTHFFLPHFSQTSSPVLNRLPDLGGLLIVAGAAVFLLAFVQIYWAKSRGLGLVTGGLYAVARHPQYLGLAIVGLGTLLVWPRYLVLIMYVTMIFLYGAMARWEEGRCAAEFGGYRAYQGRTGMFWPRRLVRMRARLLPPSGGRRVGVVLTIYAVVVGAAVAVGHELRDYSLSRLSSFYTPDMAVLSPAVLTRDELGTALRVAMADNAVREGLSAAGRTAKLLVYVVPLEWRLPDLPLEVAPGPGGHYTPRDFDRRLYKVLFTKVRAHDETIAGRDIVTNAYGLDPIIVAKVNTESGQITAVETPPAHVRWGDIPTPLF
jgi:class 3 adenylate cyclase/protein-S-isoprenylcysteine O-methyltransferase Ste14